MTTTITEGQIKRLVERAERVTLLRLFVPPYLSWGSMAASIGGFWGLGLSPLSWIFGSALFLLSIQISREAANSVRQFKQGPALKVWREVADDSRLLPEPSAETYELMKSLRSLYATDKRGEVLPVVQAARLLVIYDLQQHRRKTIVQRCIQLQQIREQLDDKAMRLQALGDPNPLATTSVEEMAREIPALERLADDILSSCHRLETIVLSVHRAVQVKQLHREIADLKSSVSPEKTGASQLVSPEITDIERQIGREIETFLQLERETDAHLREL